MSTSPRHRSSLAEHPAVRDILPQFIARLPGHVQSLRSLAAGGDAEGLKLLAHKLRGSGKSFGFAPISAYAAEIEEGLLAGKSGPELEAPLSALIAYMEQVDGYAPG